MAKPTRAENIEKMRELIKGIDMCMLTTVDEDGSLRSRPMSTQEVEFDGDLWFFTGASTDKVTEVSREQQVNISYADAGNNRFVSVSGMARLVRDKKKIKDLWNPFLKAWFPDGLEDPDLALLKVTVHKAEYWDAPHGKVATLLGFVKALATGENADDVLENEKLTLKRS
ncbi:MAG: pyridoxamine 5'-phosphate oxidase family protein [Burkholderiales bacterium]|nr:pyridoxamine 5'-phosphate oxidase family protein [Anaerolineae bacterium]